MKKDKSNKTIIILFIVLFIFMGSITAWEIYRYIQINSYLDELSQNMDSWNKYAIETRASVSDTKALIAAVNEDISKKIEKLATIEYVDRQISSASDSTYDAISEIESAQNSIRVAPSGYLYYRP